MTAAPAAEAVARQMPEARLQEAVRKMAAVYGWLYWHDHDSRRNPEGYPDCTLVKGERIIFAELKTERGQLTTQQQVWRFALQAVESGSDRVLYALWRPSDLMYGRIEGVLSTLTYIRGNTEAEMDNAK